MQSQSPFKTETLSKGNPAFATQYSSYELVQRALAVPIIQDPEKSGTFLKG